MKQPPALIAHRGDMTMLPENTLPAIEHALAAGAAFVEFDVQLSSDGVPVLFHDLDMARTTGIPGEIGERAAQELGAIVADHHMATTHPGATIPTLQAAVRTLNGNRNTTVFVELKRHSVERFGREAAVDAVMDVMQASGFPWVFLSFDHHTLEYARERYQVPVGLALREYTQQYEDILRALSPEYAFCNRLKIGTGIARLWEGGWTWVIYDVTDAREVSRWQEAGATMIETGAIAQMMRASMYADAG